MASRTGSKRDYGRLSMVRRQGGRRKHIIRAPRRQKFTATGNMKQFSTSRNSEQHKLTDASHEECFVVSIDFGATYSAVAYTRVNHKAFLEKRLEPVSSNQYRTLNNFAHSSDTSSTVSSSLLYDKRVPGKEPVKWGYGADYTRIPHREHHWKVSCPKMLLSSRPKDKSFVRSMKEIGKKVEKSGIDMVTDFLRELKTKFETDLKLQNKNFAHMPKHYYCGFPPGWKPEEITKLSQACLNAGLDGVRMISEPEAAANALLADDTFNKQNLEKGDGILVIDAGGMTVDTIVYEIIQTKPSFATKEVMVGDSENCGSAFMNTRCREAIRNWEHFSSYSDEAREPLADYGADKFEVFKRHSLKEDPRDQIDFEIEYPLNIVRQIIPSDGKGWDNFVLPRFSQDRISKELMEPSLQETVQLVKKAIRRAARNSVTIKRIFLTGGFSASAYLHNRLQKNIFKTHDIELFRPNIPEAAVAQGIITIALSQSAVRSTTSRLSIGLDELQEYNHEVHGSKVRVQPVWDKTDRTECVRSIGWIIRRGETMEDGKVWSLERRRTIPVSYFDARCVKDPWWKFDEEVIGTELEARDNIDRTFNSGKKKVKGKAVNDTCCLRRGFFQFGRFVVDLGTLPESGRNSLLSPRREGEDFLELHYKYEITLQGRELTFKFISQIDPTVTILLNPFNLEEDIAHHSINYLSCSPEPDSAREDTRQKISNPPLFGLPALDAANGLSRERLLSRKRSETISAESSPTENNVATDTLDANCAQHPPFNGDIWCPPDSPPPELLPSTPPRKQQSTPRLTSVRQLDNGGPGPATTAHRAREAERRLARRSKTSSLEGKHAVAVPMPETRPRKSAGLQLGGFKQDNPLSSNDLTSVGNNTPHDRTIIKAARQSPSLRPRLSARKSRNLIPQASSETAAPPEPRTPLQQLGMLMTPQDTVQRRPKSPRPPSRHTGTFPQTPSSVASSRPQQCSESGSETDSSSDPSSIPASPSHSRSRSSSTLRSSQPLSQNTALNNEIIELELSSSVIAVQPGQKRKRPGEGTYTVKEMLPEWVSKRRRRVAEEEEEDDEWNPSQWPRVFHDDTSGCDST